MARKKGSPVEEPEQLQLLGKSEETAGQTGGLGNPAGRG